jgi:hypothetical protein
MLSGQQRAPTKSRDISKRAACHVTVAEDGHTPTVANSNFGVRAQQISKHRAIRVVRNVTFGVILDSAVEVQPEAG